MGQAQKKALRWLSRIFISVFFILLIGMLSLVLYFVFRDQRERRPLDLRAAITSFHYQHGSSITCFIDLSNGRHFLFTVPPSGMRVGDSVIKIGGQDYFTISRPDGSVICRVGLNGQRLHR